MAQRLYAVTAMDTARCWVIVAITIGSTGGRQPGVATAIVPLSCHRHPGQQLLLRWRMLRLLEPVTALLVHPGVLGGLAGSQQWCVATVIGSGIMVAWCVYGPQPGGVSATQQEALEG